MLYITLNPYGWVGFTTDKKNATWYDGNEEPHQDSCTSAVYWNQVTAENIENISHSIPTRDKIIPVGAEMGEKIKSLIKNNSKWLSLIQA